MKEHSTSPPCGNLVDGLPHDCYTETVAKPARLGSAQNDELPPQNDRVDKVLLDDMKKCKENLVERMLKINMDVIKYRKRNDTTRLMIYQNFGQFRKYGNFR